MSSGKQPVLILCFIFFFEFCRACPIVCVCKWKNGKQTVECDQRDLLAIPKGIDPGTQVLNFSGNNLQTLSKEKFLRMDLINLQRIYLSRCRISSVDDRAFTGLTNLVELDLSDNLLVSVPTETFADCPLVMKLILNSNPIRTLRKDAFNGLFYLTTLEVGDCDISSIEEGAFHGLQRLEWLRLDGNKLTTVRYAQSLPKTLRGIELQGNLWECDCHILDLHKRLQGFSIPQTMEPVCNGPSRLIGRNVRSIAISDFACLPDVSPTTFYLEIGEGKNVSLLCNVRAIPEARVSWLFQGRTLQNDSIIAPGLHLLYFIEEGLENKRSELFIYNTNSEDNGTFICTAENNAGITASNFTLRIVIKHQHSALVVVAFSHEYILIILSAGAVFAVMTILVVVIYAVKVSRSRKTRKNKKMTSSNSTKDSLLHDSGEEYSDPLKECRDIIVVDRHREMMIHSTPRVLDEAFTSAVMSPTSSLNRLQTEQNPDLINGTESIGRNRESEVVDQPNRSSYGKAMENAITNFDLHSSSAKPVPVEFRQNTHEFCSLPVDVHLNPIGLLNANESRANMYKTLPHNRTCRQPALSRYSRDAEYLPRNSHEHYCPGVRYTADGYLACRSPPEYLQPLSEPWCPTLIQWPHCVPAASIRTNPVPQDISKRCVSAQTDSESTKSNLGCENPINKSLLNVRMQEVLTESPDEGYEGESAESNSNPG